MAKITQKLKNIISEVAMPFIIVISALTIAYLLTPSASNFLNGRGIMIQDPTIVSMLLYLIFLAFFLFTLSTRRKI